MIGGVSSGIMGLAFQGIANTQALPFWQGILGQNLLTNPEFSFFLARHVNDANAKADSPGGTFTLGGTHASLFQGTIDYRAFTPPTGGSFWLQKISGMSRTSMLDGFNCKGSSARVLPGVTVNGKAITVGAQNAAIIDTGATLIGGPSAAVKAFWAAVPNAVALSGAYAGLYAFRAYSVSIFRGARLHTAELTRCTHT